MLKPIIGALALSLAILPSVHAESPRALKGRMPAEVKHIYYDPRPGEKATRPALPIFGNPHCADGYDVVIHNECAADEDSAAALDAVLAPQRKGVPAVNLHCAMHSYRSGTWKQPVKAGDANARWFEFTGIQSTGHGPQSPIRLAVANNAHPIAAGFLPYTTGNDELYNNLTSFDVTPVLTGVQPESKVEADRGKVLTVAWTHRYGPQRARIQHHAGAQHGRDGRSALPRSRRAGRPLGGAKTPSAVRMRRCSRPP